MSTTPFARFCRSILLWLTITGFGASLLRSAEFTLTDGDLVVLLGDSLIEQEQYVGWLELALTTAYPDHDLSFRNIGWSGDTPGGASRFGLSLLQAGHEPADEGWKQLVQQLQLTPPSVLVLGYGRASAIEGGAAGQPQFEREYERLLTTAREINPKVRFLFLTPVAQVNATPSRQHILKSYTDSIRTLASKYESPIVDLSEVTASSELHQDSIHLNSNGYRRVAAHVCESLGLPASDWEQNSVAEDLRKVIIRKNQWWFHRSRPANMAYVFGFRKREQGQNAAEIPEYDTLVQAEETRIRRLRHLKPVDVPVAEPVLESKFAEFEEQPQPEFMIDPDWEIELWAQNPLLNKPIHMNFDTDGRLWIASSEAYPMIEVGQSAPDRIVVLEDSTGDGRADKSTVFADGLLIPTGVAPGDGGVYVAQSTDLLFLQDRDGDGRADTKSRVLTGFGTEDTHHNLHTLRWGPDGRLYMNQSVYTRSDLETPYDIVRLKAGGGIRLDTQSLKADIFFRGLWNSWGHQFDAYGQSFLSDGAGFDGLAYAFPGASFNPVPRSEHTLGLISPGRWPKFASLEIIQGENFPPEWQGSLVTCDFRANRVTRFSLAEQDAGYVTQQEDDVVRSSAATFRPIDVKQGPDGALYIADWSNPIINHGEVDFRDPRRDRWHGRIWRLTWKGASPKPRLKLTNKTISELFALLASEDRYDRDQARRSLTERKDETLLALESWLASDPVRGSTDLQLEGLWLCQTHNHVEQPLLEKLLSAENHRARAAATRVLSFWLDRIPNHLELLRECINDVHPRVRLEAVRALSFLAGDEAVEIALGVLEHEMDDYLQYTLDETMRVLQP